MPINLYFFHIYFYLHKCKQLLSKLGSRPSSAQEPFAVGKEKGERPPGSGSGPSFPLGIDSQTQKNLGSLLTHLWHLRTLKRSVQVSLTPPGSPPGPPRFN